MDISDGAYPAAGQENDSGSGDSSSDEEDTLMEQIAQTKAAVSD